MRTAMTGCCGRRKIRLRLVVLLCFSGCVSLVYFSLRNTASHLDGANEVDESRNRTSNLWDKVLNDLDFGIIKYLGSERDAPNRTSTRKTIKAGNEPLQDDSLRINTRMTMLTDSNLTKIEIPWEHPAKLFNECANLGESYYRSLGRLPTASVVITFHSGETWYNLLHTVHSIFQRTPPNLLREVILVDDYTNKDDFGEALEVYTETLFGNKVKILRNDQNLGLIQSRLKGIRTSTGEVFVVMDSHSEVQAMWLEPLLYEIKKNRRTYANSLIDWMRKENDGWHYKYTGNAWMVNFDWKLVFGWQPLSAEAVRSRSLTDPITLKVVIGAYGAMDKEFFEEIGAYDERMQLWGGENIDLAVRTWLFGGRVISVPCSRVAHFEQRGSRDYRKNYTNLFQINYKRFAQVWLDDYLKYYYAYNPDAMTIDAGNLTSRFDVKRRAWYNFDWYLSNVYPELGIYDRNSLAWGQLQNADSKMCLEASLTVYRCSKQLTANQIFFWSDKFELRRDITIVMARVMAGFTVDAVNHAYIPYFNNDLATKWIHWKGGPMVDVSTKRCLEGDAASKKVHLNPCNFGLKQLWTFSNYSTVTSEQLLSSGPVRYPDVVNVLRSIMTQTGQLPTRISNPHV